MSHTITLSEHTFQLLAQRAEQLHQSPTDIAEAVLARHLMPLPAYIELVQTIAGERAMLKGTRIPVSIIVGYIQAGEPPETLASEVMPDVPLAAIHDALRYYSDHREEIDRERAENTEEASKKYLRERLGDEGYRHLTGRSLL